MKDELMDRAPRVNRNSARDRMDAIPHLCDAVRTLPEACPTEARLVLLILDGHKMHTNNLLFIEMARANFVTVICLPPHCSHRMQPLGVSFVKPLMTYYTQAVECWLRSHPGRVVSTFQIAELFGIGYVRAATVRTAVNGFRKTGIWPIDRNVFDEHDFAAAQPTDLIRQPNTYAPPPDRDTDAPPRDRNTDAPPRDRDTDAPPRDRDTDAPPRDRHRQVCVARLATDTPAGSIHNICKINQATGVRPLLTFLFIVSRM